MWEEKLGTFECFSKTDKDFQAPKVAKDDLQDFMGCSAPEKGFLVTYKALNQEQAVDPDGVLCNQQRKWKRQSLSRVNAPYPVRKRSQDRGH